MSYKDEKPRDARSETQALNKEASQCNFLVPNSTNSKSAYVASQQKHYCGTKVIVGRSANSDGTQVRRVFCNTYGCPQCGWRKKLILCHAIARCMKEHNLRVFVTLTIPPTACSPAQSVRYIKALWNKHRVYQKKFFERLVEYVSVLEFQKNGMAHLHVLMSEFVPWDWLNKTWKDLGGGHVHVEKADVKACFYMGKYLSKSLAESNGERVRRVCCSRGIKLRERVGAVGFRFENVEYATLKRLCFDEIREVFRNSRGLEVGFETTKYPRFIFAAGGSK